MKKLLSVVLSLVMIIGVLAGCGTASSPAPAETTAVTTATAGTTAATEATAAPAAYPVQGNPKFTYWLELHPNIAPFTNNFGDTDLAKNWQEATGVSLTFEHPATGQAKEALNVLFASGKYPNFIHYQWTSYSGGPEKLFKEGIIYNLSDYLTKYGPALTSYFAENPGMARQAKSDDGSLYKFPMLMNGPLLTTTSGPYLRADLLKKHNLEAPTTIDEWEVVLTAFKDDVATPFIGTMEDIDRTFSKAFNVSANPAFYPEGNKVIKFAPLEPGYKEYIAKMADWYKKGLLDKNFSTTVRKDIDSAMASGTAAANRGSGGQQLGAYIPLIQKAIPDADFVAVQYPMMKKGEAPKYHNPYELKSTGGVVITTATKESDMENAIKFLDYNYTKEGNLLANYGIEGKTYTMKDGVPTYTEAITKPTDGKTFAQALSNWTFANWNGPFLQDEPYILQYYAYDQQKKALAEWYKGDLENREMPPITMTPEEAKKFATIMNDINTYVDEMKFKFIMGNESLDKFDKFVEDIKAMNVEEAIKIQQAALDRYLAR